MERVLVAMSGGVDSAVATGLLKAQGYVVGGATMLLRDSGRPETREAYLSAESLGVPFWIFDMRQEFHQCVIGPFCHSYQIGQTPNPCVLCNNRLKFGYFLDRAIELGFEKIATGHYATVRQDPQTGRYVVYRGADSQKDQSYMLHGLTQRQLSHVLLPLGEMTKPQVRQAGEAMGLKVAGKRDSQDICFIPDGDYMSYLKSRGIVPRPGRFVDRQGRDYGPHQGFEKYTVGQRRGLDIAYGSRIYVVEKQPDGNVVIGPNEALFSRRVWVKEVNYIPFETVDRPIRVSAKLRYSPQSAPCTLYPEPEGCQLLFDTPQRAVTAGQSAVFYAGDLLVGGGVIAGCCQE